MIGELRKKTHYKEGSQAIKTRKILKNFSRFKSPSKILSFAQSWYYDHHSCILCGSTLYFLHPSVSCKVCLADTFYFSMILIHWPHCTCPNGLMNSNMSLAHPHATGLAVYKAFFFSNGTSLNENIAIFAFSVPVLNLCWSDFCVLNAG